MKFVIVFSTILAVAFAGTVAPHIGFPEQDPSRGRVINGEEAQRGAAPYIVSLTQTSSGSHFCGGSILSENIVLTAAHCIIGGSIYVHAGLHDRNQKGEGQTVKVSRTISHEGYTGGVGPNDIALLVLESPLKLDGSKAAAVDLPQRKTQYTGVKCTLYGWGKDTAWGGLPNNLQTVTTDLLNAQECEQKLPSGSPIASTNVCSGSANAGISACNGDSGGPLVTKEKNGVVQVGIVSWGYIPCGQAGYPSVYTCTISHNDWIAEKRAQYEN